MEERADIAVVGAGAAGLFAAIWAGRTAQSSGAPLRIVAFDGARRLGAKILVAGGGRCNVTHYAVTERDFAGSTQPAIRNVLRAFGADHAVEFFAALGVQLKREETGKLFPVTDDAHTVLDALLAAAAHAGVVLRHPARVDAIERHDGGFRVSGSWGSTLAQRVILCTGGRALPKSGSDGAGYAFARGLGHSVTPLVVPALVPLILAPGHWLTALSGLALPAELTLSSGTGRRLYSTTGSTLCAHFGLSGPAVLNISRHYLAARADDPAVSLTANWLPGTSAEACDKQLLEAKGRSVLSILRERLPERMARAMCHAGGVDSAATSQQLSRDARRALVAVATACPLPVTGDRGFTHAEATAGGVPLSEVRLDTMESRSTPGLYLAGEICDVDGRIGGFNFQWAWSSGYLAGRAAARSLAPAAH